MKQVVYSVKKLGKNECKYTGVGYITDDELIISIVSERTNKSYIKLFDCVKKAIAVNDDKDEFTCKYFCEIAEYEERTYQVYYNIWFKLIK